MANCMPLFGLVCLVREKCSDFFLFFIYNKERLEGAVWDLFYLCSSSWDSYTLVLEEFHFQF